MSESVKRKKCAVAAFLANLGGRSEEGLCASRFKFPQSHWPSPFQDTVLGVTLTVGSGRTFLLFINNNYCHPTGKAYETKELHFRGGSILEKGPF